MPTRKGIIMSTGRGWFGTNSQVRHYLRTVGADCEDGIPIVRGSMASFLDGGDYAEIVIGSDCEYRRNGQWYGLATGLGTTSYGIRPVVIM